MPFVAFGWFYNTHNNIVALDWKCDQALLDIDIQLKRRHALIPNIIATVQSYTKHESHVLQAVVDARKAALIAPSPDTQLEAETAIGVSLGQLIHSVEDCPDLKARRDFKLLGDELLNCEHEIAATRRCFNLAIREYNMVLGQFPERKVAPMFRLHSRQIVDMSEDRVSFEDMAIISHN